MKLQGMDAGQRQICITFQRGKHCKTTTVKLMSGMLSPTEGSVSLLGIDPAEHPEKVHALSGVVTHP